MPSSLKPPLERASNPPMSQNNTEGQRWEGTCPKPPREKGQGQGTRPGLLRMENQSRKHKTPPQDPRGWRQRDDRDVGTKMEWSLSW